MDGYHKILGMISIVHRIKSLNPRLWLSTSLTNYNYDVDYIIKSMVNDVSP